MVSKRSRRKREKLVPSHTGSNQPLWASIIWKGLPDDLFEHVLATLPISDILRFRSVCRKWNSLLTSHRFSQYHTQLQGQGQGRYHPSFYFTSSEHSHGGLMYHQTSRKKWHMSSVPSPPSPDHLDPLASAGGLVCLAHHPHGKSYVCNPLFRSFKELPAGPSFSESCVGMTLNGNSANDGYKIFVLESNGDYKIYDSVKNSWVGVGSIPPGIVPVPGPGALDWRSRCVAIESTFYFMREDPEGIVSYDVESGALKQILTPFPRDMSYISLFQYRGKIMFVGFVQEFPSRGRYVSMWELHTKKEIVSWMEIDTIPARMCQELEIDRKSLWVKCSGGHGLLLIQIGLFEVENLVPYDIGATLVSYDVGRRVWQKFPLSSPSGHLRCGIEFNPCLVASP